MYYSNIKLNKNDFCVDTMGYSNALIIVKGGKKIVSTKRSRLFKILFPINKNLKDLMSTPSMEFICINDQIYAISPWRQLKQDYLKKGLEMYNNFGNYYINSRLELNLNKIECQQFLSIKILSMFSQKRKMEIWLSNFRYIYFNSTGLKSDVLDLVENMVEHNYDSFFFVMQNLFLKNYRKLFLTSQRGQIFDLFWDSTYDNFDLSAEKFDEAIFMTRSPVDNYNEHLLNLTSILETDRYFMEKYSSRDAFTILRESSVDLSDPNISENLYSDDFKFDPKLSYLIGIHCSENILTSVTKEDVTQKFASILSDSYTDIKTSKGMRDSKGDFWGGKEFEVVFKDKKFSEMVKSIIESFPYLSRNDFERKIKSYDETYSMKLSTIENPEFEFDVKDKIGAKGRREIYVMTENTKMMQQPLKK